MSDLHPRLSVYTYFMRRYPIFIMILLSLLLPLQAVATTLLLAPSCPAEAAMTNVDHAMDMDMDMDMAMAMDCCDDAPSAMDCQQMSACEGCNISCQLFSVSTPSFTLSAEPQVYVGINLPFVASFDPASVWRPPTYS